MSIDGTGFVDGETTVDFGGSAGTNIVVSNGGTTVSVDPPAHAAGAIQVAVTTPGWDHLADVDVHLRPGPDGDVDLP